MRSFATLRSLVALALATALLGRGATPYPAASETLDERSVEVRTNLFLEVSESALWRVLPPGWEPAPARAGPNRGATVNVIFADRLLVQDGQGRLTAGGANQHVTVVLLARDAATGAPGAIDLLGLSARPEGAPSSFGIYVHAAEAVVERAVRPGPSGARVAEEHWSFAAGEHGRVELRLRYAPGVPSRAETELRAYSAQRPGYFRIHRTDQGTDVLRSAATGVDRVEEFHFSATGGPLLGALFNGSERLVSIVSRPWYVRQAYLP